MIPVKIDKLFFVDIETVGEVSTYEELSETKKGLLESYQDWFIKRFPEESESPLADLFENKAALVAEFSKIVVISCGYVKDGGLVTTSYSGETMLEDFRKTANVFFDKGYWICGHNIKGFDLPTLSKHYCMAGLTPPKFSPTLGQKPWDLRVVDTKELWQFTNNFTLSSLDLVCKVMGIDTPKGGEVEGKNLHKFYYTSKKKDKQEIINHYCEADMQALYKLVLKLNQLK